MTEKFHQPSLQTIVEKLPGNVWWKDCELRYLGCNDRVLNVLGLSRREFIGKTDHQLWDKSLADRLKDADQEVLATGKTIQIEEKLIEASGREVIMLTNKSPYFNRAKKIAGIVGTSTDITHRKYAERALQLAKEKAEAANRAKTLFLENIRHDIRTPLTGIIGCAQVLKNVTSKEEMNRLIDSLLISSQALLQWLKHILDVVQTGAMPRSAETFDLTKLLQEIIALNHSLALQKQLKLELSVDKQLKHTVVGDPRRIQRIVLELLTNALTFTQQGFVQLTVRQIKKIRRELLIEIAVEDSGIGIAEDKQEEIFSTFSRVYPVYEGIYRGTGLGLSLAKKLVDELGGKIELKSEVGKGSRFSVQLALKEKLSKSCAEEPYSLIRTLSTSISENAVKIFILVVEDNQIAAVMVEQLLRELGCVVLVAENGKQALYLVKNNSFDLIFMDVGLPDISGIEVTRQIRQHNNQIKIIGLTAHVDEKDHQYCLEAGMNEVFTKPLLKETAIEILGEL